MFTVASAGSSQVEHSARGGSHPEGILARSHEEQHRGTLQLAPHIRAKGDGNLHCARDRTQMANYSHLRVYQTLDCFNRFSLAH